MPEKAMDIQFKAIHAYAISHVGKS